MYFASSSEGRFAVASEEARGEPWQYREDDDACAKEHERPIAEGRKDEAQRQHSGEIGNETGGEDGLAEVRGVQAELQHHRIDDGDGGGRQCHTAQPARLNAPMQQPVRNRGTT